MEFSRLVRLVSVKSRVLLGTKMLDRLKWERLMPLLIDLQCRHNQEKILRRLQLTAQPFRVEIFAAIPTCPPLGERSV